MVHIITKVLKCKLRMCRREGVAAINPVLILMVNTTGWVHRREGVADNQSYAAIDGKYHGLNAQEGGSCKLEYKNGWNIQNLSYILEACGVVNISSVSRLTFHGPFLVMYDAPQSIPQTPFLSGSLLCSPVRLWMNSVTQNALYTSSLPSPMK